MEEEELKLPEEVVWRPQEATEVGANSLDGSQVDMALAPNLAEVSDVPMVTEMTPVESGEIEYNMELVEAVGPNISENHYVQGDVGQGVNGASGAVDRITKEILLSLEERKTLVVWLFDQSGSLSRQRSAIKDRFDKIYEELGVLEAANNKAFAKYQDKPLLTSVVAFGEQIKMMTEKPTDNLVEIKEAVEQISQDDSGVERVFFRHLHGGQDSTPPTASLPRVNPSRNATWMLVVFTDEAGDDVRGDGRDDSVLSSV